MIKAAFTIRLLFFWEPAGWLPFQGRQPPRTALSAAIFLVFSIKKPKRIFATIAGS